MSHTLTSNNKINFEIKALHSAHTQNALFFDNGLSGGINHQTVPKIHLFCVDSLICPFSWKCIALNMFGVVIPELLCIEKFRYK